MRRIAPLLLVPFALAACGSGAPSTADASADGGAPPGDGATPPPDGATDGATTPPPVAIREGRLEIDGVPTFLFGGDVPYFRIRDPNFDAQKTQALWKDTAARMKASKMTLVSTYFPWDYHAPSDGVWDFTGARDADAFLAAVCGEGLKVIAKPGPLITGEWPRGFGSFGAVPDWWKAAHPEALVKTSTGADFDFQSLPMGAPSKQPSYLHPTYLGAVDQWFDKIVPIIAKYVASRCVMGVQVYNETNLYWSERFGQVDYNPVAVDHFHQWLPKRWASLGALNAAYGTSYATFDAVPPPKKLPQALADDVAARDWYDAGQALVSDYLHVIRGKLEARGIKEPDVLFLTNDSPFTIAGSAANAERHILIHDGRVKNAVGLSGLDAYPKQFPDAPNTSGPIANQPFQADYFTKLYGFDARVYTKDPAHPFAFGAELQGGFYSLPLGITAVVSPEATDQLLAKTIGHGLKGASFYVMRGGINLDGSSYDFQAAFGLDGSERPRLDVLRKWARFVDAWGASLQSAEEVEDPIAIVQDITYAAPQAGTNDDLPMMYTNEHPALFGWLKTAGLNPAVVDAQQSPDLSKAKVAFFFAPKMVDPRTAKQLTAFVAKGGVLVQMLDPGSFGLDGKADADVSALASLFPATASGSWTWPGLPYSVHSGDMNSKVPNATGTVKGFWYQTYFTPKNGAQATPLVVERKAISGADGQPIALSFGGGTARALVGTYVATDFNTEAYYSADAAELDRRRALARALAALGGVTPARYADEVRAEVWARRVPGSKPAWLVFVANDGDARTVHVHVGALAMGLSAQASYAVTDELTATSFGTRTGAQLDAATVDLPMAKYGTAVLSLR